MAVSYIDSVFNEDSSGVSTQTTNVLTCPAGTIDGSHGFFFLVANQPTSGLVTPSGLTLIEGPVNNVGHSTNMQVYAWWTAMGASDAGSTTYTFTDGLNGSKKSTLGLIVMSGGDPTGLLHSAKVDDTTATDRVTPTVASSPAGSACIELVCDRVSGNTGTWSAGSTQTLAAQDNSDALDSAVFGYKLNLSGTVGGHTYTKATSAPQAQEWTLILPPAATVAGHVLFQTLVDGTWQ